MDAVLAYLLSFSDSIGSAVQWGLDHPTAGIFFGSLVVNLAYKFLPASGFGKDIMDVILEAGKKAYVRKSKG